MTSPREWWRRATAAVKDHRSICLTMVSGSRGGLHNLDMEAAVIRATSHDERCVDYKNAGRVFAWARASPSFMSPLMWAIARRAKRTRSWPVALKSLLLAHGLLLISSNSDSNSNCYNIGRLPFDLADFRDKSPNNSGYSAFVRAYFQFLDSRVVLLSIKNDNEEDDCGINQVEKLQSLLDLLMQIRPYCDGMNLGLTLEAMDCAVIEIFEVYSGICNGIASFLVGVIGSNSKTKEEAEEERRRKGLKAISVVKRASEQSLQLTSYFEVCRSLGVLNATEFPPVDRIPDEDIMDLERLVINGGARNDQKGANKPRLKEEVPIRVMQDLIQLEDEEEEEKVPPKDWVVFEDHEFRSAQGCCGNPFVCSPPPATADRQWAPMVHCSGIPQWNGNLIELI